MASLSAIRPHLHIDIDCDGSFASIDLASFDFDTVVDNVTCCMSSAYVLSVYVCDWTLVLFTGLIEVPPCPENDSASVGVDKPSVSGMQKLIWHGTIVFSNIVWMEAWKRRRIVASASFRAGPDVPIYQIVQHGYTSLQLTWSDLWDTAVNTSVQLSWSIVLSPSFFGLYFLT